jgi:phosphoenolpyruvate phosphomutase
VKTIAELEAIRLKTLERVGYRKEAVDLPNIEYFDNDRFAETGELASLYAAREFLNGDVVLAYGDIVFDDFILGNLLRQDGDITIAVDGAWKLRGRADIKRDLVVTSGAPDPLGKNACKLSSIGSGVSLDTEEVSGEWIGLIALRASKTQEVLALLDKLAKEEPNVLRTADLPTLLNRLVANGETVTVVHSYGHWHDLDVEKDLLLASEQVSS